MSEVGYREGDCYVIGIDSFHAVVPAVLSGTTERILKGQDNTAVITVSHVDFTDFCSYRNRLSEAKFQRIASSEVGGNVFLTARNGEVMLTAYYIRNDGEIRVIVEPYYAYTLATPCRELTEPAVFASSVSDRTFYIRLPDNMAVVIDGGWRIEDFTGFSHKYLFDGFVKELQTIVGGEKIHVTAWFITHPHLDHGNFLENVEKYGYLPYFSIDRIVRNFSDKRYLRDGICLEDYAYIDTLEEAIKRLPVKELIYARLGMVFDFSGVKFEILFTPDDDMSERFSTINGLSLVIRQTYRGKSILWTGDMSDRAGNRVISMFAPLLPCDGVQIAHHGWGNGGTAEFYDRCAAKIQFWSNSEYGFRFFDKNQGYGKTKVATYVYDMPCCERHIFCNHIKMEELTLR